MKVKAKLRKELSTENLDTEKCDPLTLPSPPEIGPSFSNEVTLTHQTMLTPVFNIGLDKLIKAPSDIKLGSINRYWLGRFGVEIMFFLKEYEKARIKIAELYADKDSTGKPIMKPTVFYRTVLDEKTNESIVKQFPKIGEDGRPIVQYCFEQNLGAQEDVQKELSDLISSVVPIPFHKINIDLVVIGDYLQSDELYALEGIINWIIPAEKQEEIK